MESLEPKAKFRRLESDFWETWKHNYSTNTIIKTELPISKKPWDFGCRLEALVFCLSKIVKWKKRLCFCFAVTLERSGDAYGLGLVWAQVISALSMVPSLPSFSCPYLIKEKDPIEPPKMKMKHHSRIYFYFK